MATLFAITCIELYCCTIILLSFYLYLTATLWYGINTRVRKRSGVHLSPYFLQPNFRISLIYRLVPLFGRTPGP